jgi:hypothetical protein
MRSIAKRQTKESLEKAAKNYEELARLAEKIRTVQDLSEEAT